MRARAAVGLLVAAALLASCADDPSGSTDPPSTTLRGSITVAAAGGEGELKAVQGVAEAFESAHPGTTVTLDTVAEAGELVASLTTAFAAGRAPDVFVLNYRRLGAFAAAKVVDPVPAGSTAGLYEKPLDAFTFNGTLLCLPSNAASMVVYTNTELFQSAGVALPKAGWTWSDMLATAKELKAKGTSAVGFDPALIRLAPFVWSNGGELVESNDAPTSVDLSSAEAREAIQFLLDLQEQGMSATDRASQEPEQAFAAGKVAMHLDSRRAVPGFRKTEGLAFDVAPVPTKKSAVSVLHSDGYCVTKASENKPLARAFAAYVVSGAGSSLLAQSGRAVPVKKEVAESADFLDADRPPTSSRVFLDQLASSRALPHSATWNEAEGVSDEILVQLFAGKTSVDEAISDIARLTEDELAHR